MKWGLCVLLFLVELCPLNVCLPRQYHFIDKTLTWLEAQTYCREQYTDLATVDNIEDMNRLVNTAQDSTGGFKGQAWIGLHENLTNWRWSFSDWSYYRYKERDYRNWDVFQPDRVHGNKMCVRMWTRGFWDDLQCSLKIPFICYDGRTSSTQRFIYVRTHLNWFEARRYCRRHHTDLASIRNEKENQEIHRLAQDRGVWIGLYRTREWSDQSESTYRNWKQGQPDHFGGKENCTAADLGNAGLWSDERCSRKLVFMCYGEKKEMPDVPVLSTTTTEIPNAIATTEEDSTTTNTIPSLRPPTPELGPAASTPVTAPSTKTSSLEHPSITKVDQTKTSTMTIHKGTTSDIKSTTRITSLWQPLTTGVDEMIAITKDEDETPNKPSLPTTTTNAIPTLNVETTRETESSNGVPHNVFTSTPLTDQTRSITGKTPNWPHSSTTTTKGCLCPCHCTDQTGSYVSSENTSVRQPATTEVDKERANTKGNPSQSLFTTTETPNRSMSTETGHLTTDVVLSQQPSTTEVTQTRTTSETPNLPHQSTTVTTVTPKTSNTPATESTRGTSSTSPPKTITGKTSNKPLISINTTSITFTPNKRTTNEIKSTNGQLTTEIVSPEQPSVPTGDQTRPFIKETTDIPTRRVSTTTEPTTGPVSTKFTSFRQPSTTEEHQIRTVTSETPSLPLLSTTITSMASERRTTTEMESTVGYLSTKKMPIGQPSSTVFGPPKNITNKTTNEPHLSSTTSITVTPYQETTTDLKSTTGRLTTEINSSKKPSTTKVHQTMPTSEETPKTPPTTTTTEIPDTVTTTDIKSTTGHAIEGITSHGQPSTTGEDQTRPFTSDYTVTQEKRTQTEIESTTGPSISTKQPSTTTQHKPLLTTATTSTTLTQTEKTSPGSKSTSAHVSPKDTSSGQTSTAKEDQASHTTSESQNRPLSSPRTEALSNKETTTKTASAVQYVSVDQRKNNKTPNQPSLSTTGTTVTPGTGTSSYIKSSTVHISTERSSPEKPLTTEVHPTRIMTEASKMSATMVMPDTRTTTMTETNTEPHSRGITPVSQPSTTVVDQERTFTYETPNTHPFSTTTNTPHTTTSTDTGSTTNHASDEITSHDQPSTTGADQKRAFTSDYTVTQEKRTHTGIKSTTGPSISTKQPSTTTQHKPLLSTATTSTTLTPTEKTSPGSKSTSAHVSTKVTSSGQTSTTIEDQTTTSTTLTPTEKTSAGSKSTFAQVSTKVTSSGQISITKEDQAITSTTLTQTEKTSPGSKSTSAHVSTKVTSSGQTSTTKEDQSTTSNTFTPTKRTTPGTESTTGHQSTGINSSQQPSTTAVPESETITNTRTSTNIESTTGHFNAKTASSKQPLTTEIGQSRTSTSGTQNGPLSSTTSKTTPNKRSTTKTKSTTGHVDTVTTSFKQPSTTKLDETHTVTNTTPCDPLPSSTTSTTLIPNMRTTFEIQSKTGHPSREMSSAKQHSTPHVTQTRATTSTPVLATTKKEIPNSRTTTDIKSTTVRPRKTSSEKLSTTKMDQTKTLTIETTNSPLSSTTTGTPDRSTTTDTQSTTSSLSTEFISSKQPSTTEVDQTSTTSTDGAQNKEILSTTLTTQVPNKRPTTEMETTAGRVSTEMVSAEPSSATKLDRTESVTDETPNWTPLSTYTTSTKLNPSKRTTNNINKATTGHASTEMTSSKQSPTTEVHQTRPITTTLAITTVTEIKSTTGDDSTEITSLGQPLTKEEYQTKSTTDQTSHKSTYSTVTTMAPSKGTTSVQPTTSHFSTEETSPEQPLTFRTDQTNPISSEAPNKYHLSTGTTTEVPQKVSTNERLSASTEFTSENTEDLRVATSEQLSTPQVDQTGPSTDYVVILGVKLSSGTQMSEDELKELVAVQFRNLLIEKGLPGSIKVSLLRRLG